MTDPIAAADAVVAAVDPGLSSPGVESRDVVLVTGPWLAGATSLIDALRERMPEQAFVEADDLSPADAPVAVVFVVSAIASLTESDCALVDLAANYTDLVIGVVCEDRCAPQLARRTGHQPVPARRTRAALSPCAMGGGRGRTGSGRAQARRTGGSVAAAAGRSRCAAPKPVARVGSAAVHRDRPLPDRRGRIGPAGAGERIAQEPRRHSAWAAAVEVRTHHRAAQPDPAGAGAADLFRPQPLHVGACGTARRRLEYEPPPGR